MKKFLPDKYPMRNLDNDEVADFKVALQTLGRLAAKDGMEFEIDFYRKRNLKHNHPCIFS